ncbi:anionic trypsin-like [Elgaria multicarinata webbii]|uniref:anionic trypsin-like n=1 Tax=Elgaria multicarinata webbii TaxID=159646 RepID=UPI002FCCC9A5
MKWREQPLADRTHHYDNFDAACHYVAFTFLNGSIHVRLGEVNLDVLDGTEQFKIVAKTVIHPDFNHTSHDNDIMLVKLLSPAELNCYVHPIGLATHRTSPGEECLVSGWGTPINYPGNIPLLLYCAAVRIIPFKKCVALYSGNVNHDMFCAASLEGGTDSCEGDSGGPLVCNGKLQGVVSWGDVPCISTTKPGVYMDVFRYRDWIDKVMRDN